MKKRGKGIATIGYPTGVYRGGDPNQAEIGLKMDGTLDLLLGSSDLGQGCKTILPQIAAEELDVPVETITFTNTDTDVAPYCRGTFASRVTFIGGNATIKACQDLKEKMKQYAAQRMATEPGNLDVADSRVFIRRNPERGMGFAEIGTASIMDGQLLVGFGAYAPEGPFPIDPATGEQPVLASSAFATAILDVEVDTSTGVVEMLKGVYVYEIGKAINPLMCKMQINGGSAIGIGNALSEDAHPYWPSVDFAVESLGDYVVMTAADMPPDNRYAIVEIPHPDGPYGAKGFAEMTANVQIPAITAAIHDAIGVWITQFPITPELILRALESKKVPGGITDPIIRHSKMRNIQKIQR
jgi:CO/xanthine dehydrogenase Mo-binding subunit